MDIVPGESVGELRFRSIPEAVVERLGPTDSKRDYGDGRTGWDYGDELSVLFKAGVGLVAVTLNQGPANLWGHDIFGLSIDELCRMFAQRDVETRTEADSRGDAVVSAEACGLFVYFVEGIRIPQAVEVYLGSWDHGQAVRL